MRIIDCDIWTVVVPVLPGTVTSPEYGEPSWPPMSKHIIRLKTSDGVYGLGETGRGCPISAVKQAAASLVDQDPLQISLQEIPLSGPAPVRPSRDYEALFGDAHGNPAYSAFEMALFDLVGRAIGVPAHWLLGGAVRERVPVDYWIGQQNPEDAARNAKKGKDRGFHGMKMKCVVDDPWEERVGAILDACGPDFKLTLDPNERFYRPAEAIALAKKLERFPNIAMYEDPMPKWNLDWYVQFRAAVTAPVALHLANPRDVVSAIKMEACDHFNLAGTMVQFVRSAAMAAAYGSLCWHGSGVDLGIMEHSYLHAAACARNCVLPSDLVGSWVREDDLIVDGLKFEDGHAVVPSLPGLGCELDLNALERYKVG
jgi:muconate cycloisomerase